MNPTARKIQATLAAKSCTPIHALVELTGRCIQSCPFCYKPSSQQELELSTIEVKGALKDLASLGCFTVEFSGGEVLLREDLREIVEAAREHAFVVHLLTNGQLLTRDMARWMSELGVGTVQVALHGAAAAEHDSAVQSPGAFAKVREAVGLLQEAAVRVRVACVVTRFNHDQVPQIMKTAAAWQAEVILNDNLIVPRRFGQPAGDFDLAEPELASFFRCNPRITEDACTVKSAHAEASQMVCGAGRLLCNVSEDGTLYPCSLLRLPAGNIKERPLRELWRSSHVLARIRSLTKADLPRCLACEHRPYCIPCVGTNFDRCGSLFEPAPQSCLRARACHSLADERAALQTDR